MTSGSSSFSFVIGRKSGRKTEGEEIRKKEGHKSGILMPKANQSQKLIVLLLLRWRAGGENGKKLVVWLFAYNTTFDLNIICFFGGGSL